VHRLEIRAHTVSACIFLEARAERAGTYHSRLSLLTGNKAWYSSTSVRTLGLPPSGCAAVKEVVTGQ
jgi:hypothetical protein